MNNATASSGDWTNPASSSSTILAMTSNPITISYSASDNIDLDSIRLYVETPATPGVYNLASTTGVSGPNSAGTIEFSPSMVGIFNFYVRSVDWFGNLSAVPAGAEATVLFDNTQPDLTLTPSGNQFTNSVTTYHIAASASEDATVITTLEYRVRQYANIDCTGTFTVIEPHTTMDLVSPPLDALNEDGTKDIDVSALAEACYRINSRAINQVGLSRFRNFDLIIDRTAPSVSAGTDQSVIAPLPVNFDATATIDNIDSLSQLTFDWDLDGDGTYETLNAGPTPTHTYLIVGIYNVHLRVTDRTGHSAVDTVDITVN